MNSIYKNRAILAGIGLLQGIALITLPQLALSENSLNNVAYGLIIFMFVAGLVFQFVWNGSFHKSQLIFSVLTGLVLSFALVWASIDANPKSTREIFQSPGPLLGGFFALYVLIAHFQTYQINKSFQYSYSELFKRSWNNIFIIFTAYSITLMFWGIMVLWTVMGTMFGTRSVETTIFSVTFAGLVLPTIAGFAIAIGKENDKLINVSRRMLLAIFGFLAPFFAVGVVVFVAAMFVNWQNVPMGKSSFTWFLFLTIWLGIVVINTIYQDLSKRPEYHKWIGWLLVVMILCLPILASFAAYGAFIESTVTSRSNYFYGRLLAIVFIYYSFAYAFSIFRQKDGLLVILKQVNVVGSLALVAVVLAINSPLLNPNKIEANALYDNIISGKQKVGWSESYMLKRKLGKSGLARRDELLARSDYPNAKKVHDVLLGKRSKLTLPIKIKVVKKIFVEARFTVYGKKKVPSGLLIAMKKALDRYQYQYRKCDKVDNRCRIIAINIDSDPDLEYLVTSHHAPHLLEVFDKVEDQWKRTGRYSTKHTSDLIRKVGIALKGDNIKTANPVAKNIIIGDIRFTHK